MIHAHVVVEENINSAVEKLAKRGDQVVELDQFKYTLGTYEKPLVEVGDSL
jgi:hypothetical protein